MPDEYQTYAIAAATAPDGSIVHDAELTADHDDLLGVEVERLRELVGDIRFSPRFPSPSQQRLLAT